MVSKHAQKIGKANGMPSLPNGPTQVTKTGNVGYVDVFMSVHLSTFALGGIVCTERVVNGLKKSAKNRVGQ